MKNALCICVFLYLFTFIYAKDFRKCDEYLRQYGYLADGKTTTANPKDREKALRTFQRFSHIPITGKYDADTALKMIQSRCGCLDVMHNRTVPGQPSRPQSFNAGPQRWRKRDLTWRLVTPLNGRLNVREQKDAIRRAFGLWANETTLTFNEVTSGNADINIQFAGRDHRIGRSDNGFDGPGRVLAHAFFPEDGRAHFDEEERWVINSNDGIELFIVAAHEFGHNLGLGHSEVESALMAPFYAGFSPDFRLDSDDIAGIRTLYGGPATATPRPSTTRRTTMRPPPPTPATTTSPRHFICEVPFRATIRAFSGELMAFVGFRSIIIMREGEGLIEGPIGSRQVFQGAPFFPDSAFNIQSNSEYFMTRGIRLFTFSARGRRIGRRPRWITGGSPAMPERTRAAMAISRNEIYMFGATQVWNWDAFENKIMDGSHRYISEEFPGIPDMLDAATAWNSTTAYFFKGTQFYTYDLQNRRVVRGPADVGAFFMPNRCS